MTLESNLNNNPSQASKFGGVLLANMAKRFQKYLEAAAEHVHIAAQMSTRNGSNKLVSRREYRWRNIASGSWCDLYGNTVDTQLPIEKVEKDDDRTRFCARLNLAWEENALQKFYSEVPIMNSQGEFIAFEGHPECNPDSEFFNEQEAINNIEHQNLLTRLEEARANYAECLEFFKFAIGTYEELTGTAFRYVPYAVKAKSPNGTEGTKAVAIAALQKKMRERNFA